MNKEDPLKFNKQKAADLLFPNKTIPGNFTIDFQKDIVQTRLSGNIDILKLIHYYQLAYFKEKSSDSNWLKERIPSMVETFTKGCKPFVNEGDFSWIPPQHEISIDFPWFGQEMKLYHTGHIADEYYYEVKITTGGQDHDLGNAVLSNLVYAQNNFSPYRLQHVFSHISNEVRVDTKSDESGLNLQKLTEKVQLIANEVFSALGEPEVPKLSEDPETSDDKGKTLKVYVTQIHSERNRGSLISTMSLHSWDSSNDLIGNTLKFNIGHNMFSSNRALSQMRGIEAMNLFMIKCSQLKREFASE